MQKVTLHRQEGVAKELIADATEVVTDTRGRTIEVRRPRPIARLRFIKAMGAASTSQLWTGMVWPLMFITRIDGVDVIAPISELEIEALYERLDEDGMEAVTEAVAKLGVAKGVDAVSARKNSE